MPICAPCQSPCCTEYIRIFRGIQHHKGRPGSSFIPDFLSCSDDNCTVLRIECKWVLWLVAFSKLIVEMYPFLLCKRKLSALVIDDIIKGRWVKADPKLRSLCVCSVLIHTNGDLSGIHPSTACSSPIRHLTAERKKFLQSPSSSSSVYECHTSYATSANGFIHE